jgi:hypothetical protein
MLVKQRIGVEKEPNRGSNHGQARESRGQPLSGLKKERRGIAR